MCSWAQSDQKKLLGQSEKQVSQPNNCAWKRERKIGGADAGKLNS